ncbi:50S ribosomal protein L11 [Candidatus Woesearchaeota archaeon]|nr:50S ribosomal protein L11 [Candidatus Woesearchaeota archaeon]
MAKKVTVDLMVEGGKATAGAQLGGTLGPLKVNIGQVVSDINKKTESFKGMQVPVKLEVNPETKEYTISVGTPPISQLIVKEANIEKGSGEPHISKAGVIAFEQVIKIAKMKEDALLANNFRSALHSVIGSCRSMGVLIEGKESAEIMKEMDAGKYDALINAEQTEIKDQEKKSRLQALGKELDTKRKQREKEKEAAKAAEAAAAAQTATAAPGTAPVEGAAAATPGKPAAKPEAKKEAGKK